jgi:hypothetical protein
VERLGLRPVLLAGLATSIGVCGAVVGLGASDSLAPLAGLAVAVTAVTFALVDGRASGRAHAVAGAAKESLLSIVGRELERSRRHERPLAIVRLRFVAGEPVGAAGKYLAMAIASTLRTIDEVLCEGDSIYLVLSETGAAEARACIRRLSDLHQGVFAEADTRLAVFPDDGVTLAALTAKLGGAERMVDPADLPTIDRRRRVIVDLRSFRANAADDITDAVDA